MSKRDSTEAAIKIKELEAQLRAAEERRQDAEERARGPAIAASRARLPQPKPFTGKSSEKVDRWVATLEHYLTGSKVDREDWVTFGVAFLEEEARDWWTYSLVSNELDEETTWEAFKELLTSQFAPVMTKEMAAMKLLDLKQKTDVATFAQEVRSMAMKAQFKHDHMTMMIFIKGLKKRTQFEVLQRKPRGFAEAVNYAAEYESVGYDAVRTTVATARPRTNSNDASAKGRGMSDAEHEKLLRTGACFHCRETGHLRVNCPQLQGKDGGQQA
jgi:hypothetical protein